MSRAAIFFLLAPIAAAQTPDPIARDIFRQLIEINTTDSVGNNTTAAQAMAKRLLDAGFPASDVQVLGPSDRKGNMVARYRGASPGGLKPILFLGHLDVVEARREDWTIFADPKLKVEYIATGGAVSATAPEKKAFTPIAPSPAMLRPLEKIAAEMWPGAPVIPEMETGASDSIYTMAVGIPSYGINGCAIDADDIRAHGKDERVRASAYADNVKFFYLYLKSLGSH
jgi:acetylornithine deacetylase/succinyl-diaminopimelate desuccinylase-like protein